ncbi:MAG: nucleoside-diphosphate sugar epimerase/dehydratase [Burkholderiaceae bacterium]
MSVGAKLATRLNWRAALAWLHDVAAAALSLMLAYAIRLNFEGTWWVFESVWQLLPWLLPVQAAAFWASGLYRGLWRYASLRDIRQIALAAGLATVAIPVVTLLLRLDVVVPRSVLVIFPVLLGFFMAGSRLAYRMWREHRLTVVTREQGDPVIVIGAGNAAAKLLRELANSTLYKAVALLDDDPNKHGRILEGVRVVGPIERFAEIARQFNTQVAIVAMPGVSHDVRRRVVNILSAAGARILSVPSLEETLRGARASVRPIELEDLLGRDPVNLDMEALRRSYTGKVILVTGAGGSIGSELCRQLLRFGPAALVLFDLSEFALYRLTEEFSAPSQPTPIVPLVGDVKDRARVEQVLSLHRPDVIFHAAAYKHVPLMEDLNAWEAVRNNSYGTLLIGEAAVRHGIERFVLVSTDKAVNPTNVMGASKRLAEMVCQSLNQRGATRFTIVRFGNVLGSSGSVIPKFQAQITGGGPVTVTHPEVIRYFMSIPEAAQLVLQAGAMGDGGEIFVLDMGAPVKIVDLARDMIRLAGYTEQQIEIRFTGLRPGEKLYEELIADDETTRPTAHPKVRVASGAHHASRLDADALVWLSSNAWLDDQEVRLGLSRWVPEYAPAQPMVSTSMQAAQQASESEPPAVRSTPRTCGRLHCPR